MENRRVRDVMTSLVLMVHPDDPIQYVTDRLRRNRITGAPVVDNGKVVGVISEVDIARASARSARARMAPVAIDVMSTPAVTIGMENSLVTAAQLLDRHGIKRLPVVDESGYLLGIVSRGDLVRSMTQATNKVAV